MWKWKMRIRRLSSWDWALLMCYHVADRGKAKTAYGYKWKFNENSVANESNWRMIVFVFVLKVVPIFCILIVETSTVNSKSTINIWTMFLNRLFWLLLTKFHFHLARNICMYSHVDISLRRRDNWTHCPRRSLFNNMWWNKQCLCKQ